MTEPECQASLRRFREETDALMEFLGARLPRLKRADREQARTMMKTLKEKLKAEYMARTTQRAQVRMSEVERNVYYPSIHDAYSKLTVPWTSIPDGRWHSELYDARGSLDFFLR